MRESVVRVLKKGIPELSVDELIELVERPKDQSLGDYAFPCFVLAKTRKKNPVEIAKDLARFMKLPQELETVSAVGPYLNFFINQKAHAAELIAMINKQGKNYGSSTMGKGKKFMVEFSQPNTHKAFHVGHIRGTSLGESIARIQEFSGYTVVRANYSGDTGMHIAKWMWAYQTFHKGEHVRDDEAWFAKIYVEAVQKLEHDERAQEKVKEINRKLEERADTKLVKLWKDTRARSIKAWKPIYHDLDVRFNVHFFESEVDRPGKEIAQKLVKKGVAVISEGATIMDFKEDGLGVFVLLRSDGTVLYSAKDLALAELKFKKYTLQESLVITSVEQNLHFQQVRKTLERMGFPWKNYLHKGYESVRLPTGKMSSRTGDNVFYADFKHELVSEAKREIMQREKVNSKELEKRALAIALAAMKYTMLKQDLNKVIIFNKDEAVRFEGDTGPYLLYSYARAQSILRKVNKTKKLTIGSVSDHERVLLNQLSRFPEVVAQAQESLDPAVIAHYAYGVAQTFNEFYHACKVVGSEEESFRVALVKASAQTLANALHLLGIGVIERM